eukprot:IDg1895t1
MEDERLMLEALRESMGLQDIEDTPDTQKMNSGRNTETKALGEKRQSDKPRIAGRSVNVGEHYEELSNPRRKLETTGHVQELEADTVQHPRSRPAIQKHPSGRREVQYRPHHGSPRYECTELGRGEVTNSVASKIDKSDALREAPCPKCRTLSTLRRNRTGPGGRKVICRVEGGCGCSTSGNTLRRRLAPTE